MSAIFLAVLKNSVEMSAAMALALVLGYLLRKKTPAATRCFIWAGLAALLLVPLRPRIAPPFLSFDAARLPIIGRAAELAEKLAAAPFGQSGEAREADLYAAPEISVTLTEQGEGVTFTGQGGGITFAGQNAGAPVYIVLESDFAVRLSQISVRINGCKAHGISAGVYPPPQAPASPASAAFFGGPLNAFFSAAGALSLADMCFLIWIAGVFAIIAPRAFRLRKFTRETRELSRPAGGEAAKALLHVCGAKRPAPRVAVCRAVRGPVLLGVLRPVILLPDRDYAPNELYMLLSHEIAHLRRKDGFMGLIASLASAVNWFNPLARMVCRRLSVDAELACDEKVTRTFSGAEKKAYGKMLLDAASFGRAEKRFPLLPGLALTGDAKNLKYRLACVFENKKCALWASACLVLCVALALLFAAGIVYNAGTRDFDVESHWNKIRLSKAYNAGTRDFDGNYTIKIAAAKAALKSDYRYTLRQGLELGAFMKADGDKFSGFSGAATDYLF